MALSSLRLRRALTTLSSFRLSLSTSPAVFSAAPLRTLIPESAPSTSQSSLLLLQSRTFRSSSVALSASRSSNKSAESGIDPDEVLFPGCDYQHWLFVMDFPKDPKPSPEQMVATYEETCAKGLNISIEEAKKKIYACSTTTYEGFQAVMSEEEAEKFHSIPGVVFVLPDSYLYPETKEYGGDKYINGEIIPRPLPVQYKRSNNRLRDRDANPGPPRYDQRGGPMPDRQGNPPYNHQGPMQGGGRNSSLDPPRYDQRGGPMPDRQGSPPYNHQGPMQGGGRNYVASQNYGPPGGGERGGPVPNHVASQNYGPPGQEDRRGPMPNHVASQNYGPPVEGDRRGPMPNHVASQDYGPSVRGDRRGPMPNHVASQNYGPLGHGDRRGPMPNHVASQNYGPPVQVDRRGPMPNHAASQNYGPLGHGDRRGQMPNHMASQNYGPPGQREEWGSMPSYQDSYNLGQPRNYYPQGQRDFSQGDRRGYAASGPRDQMYQGYEDGQKFSEVEQRDLQEEQRNYSPRGQAQTNQGRY